jgi:tRNA pseudouridine55 synthase
MQQSAYHGWLVIDKPKGITSRDAVDCVQRWFPRGTRIGHTGTLDPLASGVLVMCIGDATRLAGIVQAMPKSYQAVILLGARSNTDDLEGKVMPAEAAQVPDSTAVSAAVASFIGEIDQIPPQYSAAKVHGRRAYSLARRGKAVELKSRRVIIYSIELRSFDYPLLELAVHCGKGAYIRSLARDLGERLNCGALLESLRRTSVGPFRVEDALAPDVDAATARARLIPPHTVLEQ